MLYRDLLYVGVALIIAASTIGLVIGAMSVGETLLALAGACTAALIDQTIGG